MRLEKITQPFPVCGIFPRFRMSSQAQTTTFIVGQLDTPGIGGNSYAGGQIGNVWGNWFRGAFQSVTWDSASDASNNPSNGLQFTIFSVTSVSPPVPTQRAGTLAICNFACTTVTQIFNLVNFTASSVAPWITSSNLSLASQSAIRFYHIQLGP